MSISVLLTIIACHGDLLPDELALPGEISAEIIEGPEGSEWGAHLDLMEDRWLIASPGEGCVETETLRSCPGPAQAVWWTEEGAYAGIPARGVFELSQELWVAEAPEGRVFAGAGSVMLWATPAEVRSQLGERWDLASVGSLAVDASGRAAALSCESTCRALELLPGGSWVDRGPAGEGGQVHFWEGVLWWSDPQLADPLGEGRLESEHGDLVLGAPGDHLGRSFGGGYAVGALHPNVVPARARVVPLYGGPVIALKDSLETRPISLAGADDTLLIGVPHTPAASGTIGRVYQVSLSELPQESLK